MLGVGGGGGGVDTASQKGTLHQNLGDVEIVTFLGRIDNCRGRGGGGGGSYHLTEWHYTIKIWDILIF